jgi:inner membrane protein
MFWGAFLGTLPDLDVLIPYGGPVDDFVFHRGFSHSLFLLALVAPLLAWLITRIHPSTKPQYKGWLVLTFVVLEASVLLDFLTVYGTQILWPFDKTPLAWPVFFIIDPLLTLPLLAGVLAALVLTRDHSLGHRLNTCGLVLSAVYMLWAFGAREFVEYRVKDKLARQQVVHEQLIVSPAPFTTLLWRIVGIDQDRYFESYFSILDGDTPLDVDYYGRNLALLQGMEQHPPVVKLSWFTRGFFAMSNRASDIVMTDLRMGSEPDYVFSFKVAEAGNPHPRPVKDQRVGNRPDWRGLAWIWQRIWQPLPLKPNQR